MDEATGINNGATVKQIKCIAKYIASEVWFNEFHYLLDERLTRQQASDIISSFQNFQKIVLDYSGLLDGANVNFTSMLINLRKRIESLCPKPVLNEVA